MLPNACPLKEEKTGGLSEIATRNLFSWTFFTEGIRTDEKPFWEHDWLKSLVKWDLGVESSECSSSGTDGKGGHQNYEYIEKWKEDVSVHAISDF
ncbi:hypothetical protein N7491_000819 [Penicillium cf. griseofulvum]|uniref:Uncharacterized protein n=1 Tax=Penicillium cf. griseofulvum TaxID=2972120 RepID=A0A9W9IPY1_9EURO|nr:hypothetical protein N7472_011226 [Penicillium cf. griseofulvum]KAJ5442981.1 hypothetical protein N7445_004732 [Penicillium cf. griseofulvum]KAJ5451637.1 hypothetical protein N7491_000819 [Penicillium cf. griseofulvum]